MQRVTVSGIGSNGQVVDHEHRATVQIDPVSSRGIDSVTTANLGRIMQGDTGDLDPLRSPRPARYANCTATSR